MLSFDQLVFPPICPYVCLSYMNLLPLKVLEESEWASNIFKKVLGGLRRLEERLRKIQKPSGISWRRRPQEGF